MGVSTAPVSMQEQIPAHLALQVVMAFVMYFLLSAQLVIQSLQIESYGGDKLDGRSWV